MSLITLTTDFGTKDHFVGAVKGAIFSELSDAKISRYHPRNISI